MSWVKALEGLKSAKDTYDSATEPADAVRAYGEKVLKLDPKSIKPQDLAYFDDDKLTPCLAEIDKVVTQLDKVLAVKKTDIPDPGDDIGDAYAELLKLAADKGKAAKGDKEVKAAATKLGKLCNAYRDTLLKLATPARVAKAEIPTKVIAAQEVYKVASQLSITMEACTKIPWGTGTEKNAEFFELYQRSEQIMAGARQIESRLLDIQDRNHDYVEEIRGVLEKTDKMIALAGKYR